MAVVPPVQIEPTRLELSPDQPAQLTLIVYNDREVIEGYTVTFFGLDAEWVAVDPQPLRLFPGSEGVITATLTLPSGYPAGEHQVGVQVTAAASGETSVIQTITLSVAPETVATLTVSPSIVTGGRRARFSVAVQNHGNTALAVALETADPEASVTSEFEPPSLTVGAGERATATMTATGKRPWVGSSAPRMITVVGKGRTEPLESLVTFMQKSIIPSWMMSLLAVLLVLIAWILTLIFGVDKVLSEEDEAEMAAATFQTEGRATEPGGGALAGVVVLAYSARRPPVGSPRRAVADSR